MRELSRPEACSHVSDGGPLENRGDRGWHKGCKTSYLWAGEEGGKMLRLAGHISTAMGVRNEGLKSGSLLWSLQFVLGRSGVVGP